MNERLQKFLNTRAKSCETQDDSPKCQSNDSGFDETSGLSSLDKQRRFTHYGATSQDGLPVSQVIMRMFDYQYHR